MKKFLLAALILVVIFSLAYLGFIQYLISKARFEFNIDNDNKYNIKPKLIYFNNNVALNAKEIKVCNMSFFLPDTATPKKNLTCLTLCIMGEYKIALAPGPKDSERILRDTYFLNKMSLNERDERGTLVQIQLDTKQEKK